MTPRPFTLSIPDDALADLRDRLARTRFPDQAPDAPWAYGADLGYMRTLVEGARDYARHTAVRRSDQLTTHHHGEADHLAWLERPFAEALRALDERGRE